MAENTVETTSEDLEFSTFYVGGALCGINILNIQEINKHFNQNDKILTKMTKIKILSQTQKINKKKSKY